MLKVLGEACPLGSHLSCCIGKGSSRSGYEEKECHFSSVPLADFMTMSDSSI